MKKIVLGCAAVLLSLGLLAGCNNEDDDVGPGPEVGGTGDDGNGNPSVVGSGYLFGFEVDGKLLAIDGGTVEGYSYEGTVTEDHTKAADITVEQVGSTSEYHISFELSSTQYWITIVTSGSHTNVSYSTSEASLYLHTNGEATFFGDEDGSHFLCYNSTYECLYCNGLTDTNSSGVAWIETAPIAGVYTLEGELLLGGKGGTIADVPESEPNADTGGTVGADPEDVTLVEVTPDLIVSSCTHSNGSSYTIGSGTVSSGDTCELDGETTTVTSWNFSISWNKGESSTSPRLWGGTPNHFRVYNKNTFTITPTEGYELRVVKFTDTNKFLTASGAYVSVTEDEEELTGGEDYVVDTGVFTMNTIESTSGVTIEIGNTTENGGHARLSSISIGVSQVTSNDEP